jgi:hypothetical protein
MKLQKMIFALGLSLLPFFSFAQEISKEKEPLSTEVAVLFGMTQPLLVGGFNIEGNLFYKRFAFDYSHGASLEFRAETAVGAMSEQGLAAHIPYSTGFGVGYRFTEWINLRVEPKWHRLQIYYDGEDYNETGFLADYTTFSLGLGLYGSWKPFKQKEHKLLRGITIAPSVRWWPTLSSSLENDQQEYYNKITEQTEIHQRQQMGMANTPWIFNISVGYSYIFD